VTIAETATRPARVLVADDEPSVLEVLEDLLTEYGYEVATVASGRAVLDRLDTFPADVLLLDIMMPGLSGNDTLAELRTRGVQIPAIAITGMPDRASPAFLAVVSKPIQMEHLNQLISGATRRRSAG
jgi:CheY-like chemotaxis protein